MTASKTVKEILVKYLQDNGYDGLVCDEYDGCGCALEDLIPCDNDCSRCEPAYKVKCNPDRGDCNGNCDYGEGRVAPYCLRLDKPKEGV